MWNDFYFWLKQNVEHITTDYLLPMHFQYSALLGKKITHFNISEAVIGHAASTCILEHGQQ